MQSPTTTPASSPRNLMLNDLGANSFYIKGDLAKVIANSPITTYTTLSTLSIRATCETCVTYKPTGSNGLAL